MTDRISTGISRLDAILHGGLLRYGINLKTRAMRHHPTVRRFEITEEGFVLGEPFTMIR